MLAVIHPVQGSPAAGLLPIAGRPLLVRQLQWLRSLGCSGGSVAVAVESERERAAVEQILRDDPLGEGAQVVTAGSKAAPRAIAGQAGFPLEAPILAIPADTISFGPPDDGGWSVQVRSLSDALGLGAAALEGALLSKSGLASWGIQIHAAEQRPGIWIGRGARVHPGAELFAPVLIGPGAVVREGARVGPRAIIEARAVIETGVTVRDAMVSPGTIVGEGLSLDGVLAEPWGLVDLESGVYRWIDDPLLLGARDGDASPELLSQALSVLILAVILPAESFARVMLGLAEEPGSNELVQAPAP